MMWLSIGLAIVVAVPLALLGLGALLPRDHVARVAIELTSPPERVFAVVSDFGGTARWRDDVKTVEMKSGPPGTVRFVETGKHGKITFELVSQEPPRRQVVRVVDDDQPFGGAWTWEIEPTSTGSRLTITEAGFIKNPLFRVMGKLFFSPSATLESYLSSLARELGEDARPRVVPVA
jgi:uncharacterized protein YndB with AHSA1/START domain